MYFAISRPFGSSDCYNQYGWMDGVQKKIQIEENGNTSWIDLNIYKWKWLRQIWTANLNLECWSGWSCCMIRCKSTRTESAIYQVYRVQIQIQGVQLEKSKSMLFKLCTGASRVLVHIWRTLVHPISHQLVNFFLGIERYVAFWYPNLRLTAESNHYLVWLKSLCSWNKACQRWTKRRPTTVAESLGHTHIMKLACTS